MIKFVFNEYMKDGYSLLPGEDEGAGSGCGPQVIPPLALATFWQVPTLCGFNYVFFYTQYFVSTDSAITLVSGGARTDRPSIKDVK